MQKEIKEKAGEHGLRTGKPELMKELNRSLIIEALEKCREATRVELSEKTGISQPTVNLLIRRMLEEQTVISLGAGESTGGRRAELFALNEKRAAIAAVLVREGGLEYAVTDLELEEEARGKLLHAAEASYTEELCAVIRKLLTATPRIKALVVGVPGAVSQEGQVFAVPQIPEWEQFFLKEYLEREFSLAVDVMNDINATASGYFAFTRDAGDMVYLHAENCGLGAGILIGGNLHPGFRSFAGEAGYMQLGQTGSLEELLASADSGQRCTILTRIVINMICILNPKRLMLGGGDFSVETAEAIREGCRAVLPEQVLPEFGVINDGDGYYLRGLCTRGRELLNQTIRVV